MKDHEDPRASLRFSIYFALQQSRYAPPKTHDATARDAYYGRTADAVMAVGVDDRTAAAREVPAD